MLINQAIDVGPEARPGAATAAEARLFGLGDADSRSRSSAAGHVPFPDGHGQAAYASREPREERSQLRKAGYGSAIPAPSEPTPFASEHCRAVARMLPRARQSMLSLCEMPTNSGC